MGIKPCPAVQEPTSLASSASAVASQVLYVLIVSK